MPRHLHRHNMPSLAPAHTGIIDARTTPLVSPAATCACTSAACTFQAEPQPLAAWRTWPCRHCCHGQTACYFHLSSSLGCLPVTRCGDLLCFQHSPRRTRAKPRLGGSGMLRRALPQTVETSPGDYRCRCLNALRFSLLQRRKRIIFHHPSARPLLPCRQRRGSFGASATAFLPTRSPFRLFARSVVWHIPLTFCDWRRAAFSPFLPLLPSRRTAALSYAPPSYPATHLSTPRLWFVLVPS